MEGRLDAIREALRSPIPWVVLSAAIALTATAWFAVERSRHDEARARFERRTEIATVAVRTRVLAYEQVLQAGAAFIASSEEVTEPEWRRFISHLQLEQRFPGIASIGHAVQLPHAIPVHHVVSPAPGAHAVAVGEDLRADALRGAAIERARRTGQPAITGPMRLPGGGGVGSATGFLMLVPVERAGESRGLVFGALRVPEVLRGVLDQNVLRILDMRVYDQAESRPARSPLLDTASASRAGTSEGEPRFSRVVDFPMPGRSWTLHYVSRPEFDALLQGHRPWTVLVAGSVASVVMFLLSTALVEAWNRAHHLSMRDPLTGLYNRRYLDETMPREVARAKRAGQDVGVIALDIDHFKRLNDSHGHDMGDNVLRRMGELLRTATRAGDIACRMGGEEFAVILPGASPEATLHRAEAIRKAFHALRFDYEGREVGPFTLSAGVSSVPTASLDWAHGLRQADRALYAAKEGGRNRVVVAAPRAIL
ncbi:MAG TPA: sensor domain-containing diguanylate cyclase [Usitatibacter sp.]|nr:sensor domain-containing diguanylate cyclase [Usitatibacter sp.]